MMLYEGLLVRRSTISRRDAHAKSRNITSEDPDKEEVPTSGNASKKQIRDWILQRPLVIFSA